MKFLKILLLIPIVIILFLSSCQTNDNVINIRFSSPPVKKKVLVEFFTNSGCTPCVAAHGYFDRITGLTGVTSNDTNVILLSFHTKYPYILDSLYQANLIQNEARSVYYGIQYTPQCRLDGLNMGQFSESEWTAQINQELAAVNYSFITLLKNYNPNDRTGSVAVTVDVYEPVPTSDNVIHIIITESNIYYPSAPNGIDYFDDVMRTMITGDNGESINLINGQQVTVNKNFTINGNWNDNECYITVFLQSTSTKAVYGVERIKVR
jgi:thiol-disulfide isomerase/thioredoxin